MQSIFDRVFVEPFLRLHDQVAAVITPLMVVMILLIVGGALAYLVRHAVACLLNAVNFNRLVDRTGMASAIMRTRVFASPADFGARLAQGFVWLLIVLMALNATSSQVTDTLIVRLVNYIPDVITAVLVLLLGSVIAIWPCTCGAAVCCARRNCVV